MIPYISKLQVYVSQVLWFIVYSPPSTYIYRYHTLRLPFLNLCRIILLTNAIVIVIPSFLCFFKLPLILINKIIKRFQQHIHVIKKKTHILISRQNNLLTNTLSDLPLSTLRFNIRTKLIYTNFDRFMNDIFLKKEIIINNWSKQRHIESRLIADARRIMFTFFSAYAIHFIMSFSSSPVDYVYCKLNLIFCKRSLMIK